MNDFTKEELSTIDYLIDSYCVHSWPPEGAYGALKSKIQSMINDYAGIKYTDYPFTALGDKVGELAPIRACYLLHYDEDKYCDIKLIESGIMANIKRCYVYDTNRRLHE